MDQGRGKQAFLSFSPVGVLRNGNFSFLVLYSSFPAIFRERVPDWSAILQNLTTAQESFCLRFSFNYRKASR